MDSVGGGGGGGKAEPGPVTVTITTTYFSSFPYLLSFLCKGDPYPEICAQRTLGAGDFFCCGLHAGAAAGFFCLQ
jgi:hypothetical protein